MIADKLNIDLTEELNLDNLPDKKKQQLIEQMTDTVTARVNHALLNRLDEEQKEELDQILENDGDVISFISDNIPNADMVVAEVIANFKQEALTLEEDIRSRVKQKAA